MLIGRWKPKLPKSKPFCKMFAIRMESNGEKIKLTELHLSMIVISLSQFQMGNQGFTTCGFNDPNFGHKTICFWPLPNSFELQNKTKYHNNNKKFWFFVFQEIVEFDFKARALEEIDFTQNRVFGDLNLENEWENQMELPIINLNSLFQTKQQRKIALRGGTLAQRWRLKCWTRISGQLHFVHVLNLRCSKTSL